MRESDRFNLQKRCELLSVNRSTVYYKHKSKVRESELCNLIVEEYKLRPALGYRKIYQELIDKGIKTSEKVVRRLMKQMNLQAVYPKPRTSIPNSSNEVRPYLLSHIEINKPNQVWAIDITYIKLPVGMAYLFAIIDWHSRYIISWKLANSMEAEHALEIMQHVLITNRPEICNADQGAQFTSAAWINLLTEHEIQISHDGVGRCIDNIRIERFWRTIKYEDVFMSQYQNLPEARAGIAEYIKYYNNKRKHQALNYQTPAHVYYRDKN